MDSVDRVMKAGTAALVRLPGFAKRFDKFDSADIVDSVLVLPLLQLN